MKLNPRIIPSQQTAKDVISAIKYDGAIPLSTEMAINVKAVIDDYFACYKASDYEHAVYNSYRSLGMISPINPQGRPMTITFCHKYYTSLTGQEQRSAKTVRFIYDAMNQLFRDKPARLLRGYLLALKRRSNNPKWQSAVDDLILLAEKEQIS